MNWGYPSWPAGFDTDDTPIYSQLLAEHSRPPRRDWPLWLLGTAAVVLVLVVLLSAFGGGR